jgi:hypothetical protein
MGKSKTLTEQVLSRLKKNNDKGGGSRKYGRNLVKCKFYRVSRSHRNKIAKLRKHLARHSNDNCAKTAYEKAMVTI